MKSKAEKVQSVVFTGYYGMENFGDDLFAYVSVSATKLYLSNTKVRLLSPSISGLNTNYAIPSFISRKVYNQTNKFGGVIRLFFALRETLKNNLFILGGGSVVSSQTSIVRDLISKTSCLTGIKFAAIGISIGPFNTPEEQRQAKQFLSGFLFITVRDKASYDIARKFALPCPVVFAGDLAGLMPLLFSKPLFVRKHDNPRIGVALCRYESIVDGDIELENQRNKALITAVISLAKQTKANVDVFSLNNHELVGDDELSRELCGQLDKQGINYNLIRNVEHGVEQVWQRIAECDFCISVRLHGAITAYLNHVPFVLIEYHRKCTDFLDDIGQSELLRIDGAVKDYDIINNVIKTLANNPIPPSISVEEYVERAKLHFVALEEEGMK